MVGGDGVEGCGGVGSGQASECRLVVGGLNGIGLATGDAVVVSSVVLIEIFFLKLILNTVYIFENIFHGNVNHRVNFLNIVLKQFEHI